MKKKKISRRKLIILSTLLALFQNTTYSLESIIKLYEGYGYAEVN